MDMDEIRARGLTTHQRRALIVARRNGGIVARVYEDGAGVEVHQVLCALAQKGMLISASVENRGEGVIDHVFQITGRGKRVAQRIFQRRN